MIEDINKISAIKIISEKGTKGSSPLYVMCDNHKKYYAKTTSKTIPRSELINEIICSYFLKIWGLKVPNIALVKIDNDVVDAFISEKGPLSERYKPSSFDDYFVGFEEVTPAIELDKYIVRFKNKHQWNQFINPLDLIKIGIFDAWVCNMDRMPKNPNILIHSNDAGFDFIPIDNAASFAYASDYKGLNSAILRLEENKLILNIPVASSIIKFVPDKELNELNEDILSCISKCQEFMDDIFNQVPNEWGFCKKARTKVKALLGDYERNVVTSKRYYPYLKKK